MKYKPAWVQLLIFGCLTLFIFITISTISLKIISRMSGFTLMELVSLDFSNPALVSVLKVFQVVSAIGLFFIPSLVFAYLSDRKPLQYAGFRKPVPTGFIMIAVFIIFASFPMVAWLGELNQHMHLPTGMKSVEASLRDAEAQNNSLLKSFLSMKSFADLLVMIFVLAVLPAITEELFFRGILQRLFIQVTRRHWSGIIITAILFSALHGQFLGFIPRMILGIVLGALFWYSGSLWPGIIAHFINNALQVMMVYYNPALADKDPNFSVLLITLSTAIVIGLTWYMRKISQTSYAEVYDTDDDFHIGSRDQYNT